MDWTPSPVTGESEKILPQLSRYGAVSLFALAVDFGTFLTLCALTLAPPVAGIAGYLAGLLVNYSLSSRYVFDLAHSLKSDQRRFAEFLLTGLLGLIITACVIGILTEVCGAPAIIAKAAAVGVSFAAVFAMRRAVVFAS